MKPLTQPLQVILFDLGDTILYFDANLRDGVFADAHQALLRSLQSSGLKLGKEFIDDFYERMEVYYRERDTEFIEYTTHYVLCNTLADWGYGDTPEPILERGLEAFHRVTQAYWIPEDDALPVLETVKAMGFRMGLVSNAADDANTQVLVDKAGIRGLMDVIVSSASVGIRKPNPRIFQYALDELGARPEQTAMVGDSLGADILGAKNAGLYGIWVTRRGQTSANLAHRDTIFPDAQIGSLSELPDLLNRLQATIMKS